MKKIICSLLTLSIITGVSNNVFAFENYNANKSSIESSDFEKSIISEICNQVVDSYKDYYYIPTIDGDIREIEQEIDGFRYTVDVSFTKVLLANDASELPYIQGMTAAIEEISDNYLKLKAEEALEARKLELNDLYIGAEQNENATFSIFVPTTRTGTQKDNYDIKFVSEFGDMDIDYFAPNSKEELYQDGKRTMDLAIKENNSQSVSYASKTNPSDVTDYDRIAARDYVRKYSCGKCTTSPHACRNKNYVFHDNADCANFVSQAIYAGGISQEDGWNPNTITWINTGYKPEYYGLVEYMVDQGFFFETSNKNKAFAGSIMFWNQYSHVGMVDANDTVTMTYCAHTSDRKSSSFKNWNGSSAGTDVKFFVPVWDSYSGSYTQR